MCKNQERKRERERESPQSTTSFQIFQEVRNRQESAITVRYVLANSSLRQLLYCSLRQGWANKMKHRAKTAKEHSVL